jgi:hypothetical protein
MRLALGIAGGFLLGGILGYYLGVLAACVVFDAGNLCGLLAVFITGPLGALGGSIAGGLLLRSRQKPGGPP